MSEDLFNLDEKLITVADLSRYLDVHHITIYKLIKEGSIPAFKVGGRWRFKKKEINEWIAARMNEAQKDAA